MKAALAGVRREGKRKEERTNVTFSSTDAETKD